MGRITSRTRRVANELRRSEFVAVWRYRLPMAWAERMPSGRYRGLYRDAAGRKRSAGAFTHKTKARNAAGALEQQARRDAWRDADSFLRPWGEWRERWLSSRVVEASTGRGDAHRLRNHLEPRWGDVPIGSITRHDVKEWVAAMRREGVGAETVRRIVHLFSASMNAAVDAEVITVNPAMRLKLVGGAPAQERYLTREEYDAIRAQLPTVRDQLIADVLVHTGLRWGEAAGLHLARVDLTRGLVRVVETFDESANRMKAYPKGRKARDVPLTPELAAAFAERASGGSCGVEHSSGRCVGPLALTAEEGGPLRNTNWAARVWHPAVRAAGVGHVRPHDCRHSYASWLLQEGISLAEVGRLLGHVSPQTTARYAHLAETPSAAVLAALSAPHLPRIGVAAGV